MSHYNRGFRMGAGIVLIGVAIFLFLNAIAPKNGYEGARQIASQEWRVEEKKETSFEVALWLSSKNLPRLGFVHRKPTWAENVKVGDSVRFRVVIPKEGALNMQSYLRPILKTK